MNQETINKFKERDGKFVLFSGSWCATCMMYLPKIMKLISAFDIGEKEVEIFEVSEGKKEPATQINKYDITFIPTLIVKFGNFEAGRIIEHPKKSWEEDVERIINSF